MTYIHNNLRYLFADYIKYSYTGIMKSYDMPFAKADASVSISFKTYLKYRFSNEWCKILAAAWGINQRELAMQVKMFNEIAGVLDTGISLSNNFYIEPKQTTSMSEGAAERLPCALIRCPLRSCKCSMLFY